MDMLIDRLQWGFFKVEVGIAIGIAIRCIFVKAINPEICAIGHHKKLTVHTCPRIPSPFKEGSCF